MDLIINNKIIYTPIIDILQELKRINQNNYLSVIEDKGDYIRITCPFHKDGQEAHPSCSVYSSRTSTEIMPGTVHCFTCGAKMSLVSLVAYILDFSEAHAAEWLTDNFSDTFVDYIDTSVFNFAQEESNPIEYLDESILNKYNFYHPYIEKRRLNPEVTSKFKVGFNPDTQAITFPIWDEHNHLVMITERSVNSKRFFIPSNKNKPIYLLNYILNNHITEVTVTESQINTLTLWGWGIPAIGLLGTGSKYQYNILKKSGIRIYHLAFDGDEAGDKAITRFIQNMPKDILIDIVLIPRGKDINDLTFEEYQKLKIKNIF